MKFRQKRLLKKLISISLTLIIIATLTIPMCISTSAAENTTHFLGGNGTKSNPYLISNANHFKNISNYDGYGTYFRLVSSIKFSSNYTWSSIYDFYGHIDGDGYSISGISTNKAVFNVNKGTIENLNIRQISSDRSGLCIVNNGTIRNCDVSGVINGETEYYVAGLAITNNGAITNCDVSANLYSKVGAAGICYTNDGIITYSNKSGETEITYYGFDDEDYGYERIIPASGIANRNYGTISYCSNESYVKGSLYTAGISAENYGLISDCYSVGTLSYFDTYQLWGYGYLGGISCINYDNIINCHSSGPGYTADINKGHIRNCYCYSSKYAEKDGMTEFTSEQRLLKSTYKGFDFDGVWKMGSEYPEISNTYSLVESIEIIDGSPVAFTSIIDIYTDISALSLKVNYTNGKQKIMKGSPFMLKKFNMNKLGEQTAPLYFGGKLTDDKVTINVVEKGTPIMSSISVSKKPKDVYVQGQTLNLKNGKLTLHYSDYTSEEIELSNANVTYDKTLTGTVPVTVEYMGFTTEFYITVNERTVSTMSLTEPDKLVYYKGEQLDLTNGKLSVVFKSSDNYSEAVPLTSEMILGYDPYKVGIQSVTVKYLNKTASFVVRVLPDKGDVNFDGKVNVVDATEIQKYIVNKDGILQDGLAVADVSGDGKINVTDATHIQKYVVGLVDKLG